MKRTIALLLALILLAVSMPTASAAQAEGQEAATALYKLGLFRGTGTNADGSPKFELERELNRYEAVVMLVRLLGKEEEATQNSLHNPFRDVDAWAEPYISYAYKEELTNGVSSQMFAGSRNASATEFLTLVLRALGYKSGTDFQWDKAWEKTDALGITDGRYKAGAAFTRGDAAIVSRNALSAKLKGSDKTLRASLEESGAIAAPENPPLTPEDLTNFVIEDFQRVRSQYPTAHADGGYAREFTDSNGDRCVFSGVSYHLDVDHYSEQTLYILSQNVFIIDPMRYYYAKSQDKSSDEAEKRKYSQLYAEVRTVLAEATRAMWDVWVNGEHAEKGLYVPPETLNA